MGNSQLTFVTSFYLKLFDLFFRKSKKYILSAK